MQQKKRGICHCVRVRRWRPPLMCEGEAGREGARATTSPVPHHLTWQTYHRLKCQQSWKASHIRDKEVGQLCSFNILLLIMKQCTGVCVVLPDGLIQRHKSINQGCRLWLTKNNFILELHTKVNACTMSGTIAVCYIEAVATTTNIS